VVIGSNATHQPQQNIADDVATTWIVNAHFEGLKDNIHYRKIDFKGDTLAQTLSLLHAHGIQSVIVEGGAKLLQSFLQADLWDEARVFTGVHTIDEGIPAPTLTNGVLAFHTPIGSDNLEVYTNKATPYPWVAGMPL
jgi:diaminohydroxyphosphoribosylaminopyrimidine deaminase/5-amino-6-(5-phosphoribosylamino)uracil reductase